MSTALAESGPSYDVGARYHDTDAPTLNPDFYYWWPGKDDDTELAVQPFTAPAGAPLTLKAEDGWVEVGYTTDDLGAWCMDPNAGDIIERFERTALTTSYDLGPATFTIETPADPAMRRLLFGIADPTHLSVGPFRVAADHLRDARDAMGDAMGATALTDDALRWWFGDHTCSTILPGRPDGCPCIGAIHDTREPHECEHGRQWVCL